MDKKVSTTWNVLLVIYIPSIIAWIMYISKFRFRSFFAAPILFIFGMLVIYVVAMIPAYMLSKIFNMIHDQRIKKSVNKKEL